MFRGSSACGRAAVRRTATKAIPGGAEVARSRVRERVRLLAVAVGGAVIGIAVGWVLVQLLLAR
jgi:uncharacterized membrane protein